MHALLQFPPINPITLLYTLKSATKNTWYFSKSSENFIFSKNNWFRKSLSEHSAAQRICRVCRELGTVVFFRKLYKIHTSWIDLRCTILDFISPFKSSLFKRGDYSRNLLRGSSRKIFFSKFPDFTSLIDSKLGILPKKNHIHIKIDIIESICSLPVPFKKIG